MKKYQFKSDIKCTGCMAKVAPFLDKHSAIKKWDVDIFTPQKVLTVESDDLTEEEIKNLVKEAGFNAQPI